ncbi:cysteine-rich repeat secretory protein 38 [Cajanus cajan]|uniref:Cysteine-rich repeat secretory protein 38 n=1 Tax=Cajanus cajan TaxID=3821 RepID=A0A151QUF9_CAJCA|nr:cysteine-rich repeat secretory protein 38 [Cajanus cajan]KYP33967.1 Cysteine-rich repeat secretory protein 38 [Cajanus cajan]
MSSSKLLTAFLFISFTLALLQTSFGDSIFHFCLGSENYTANSTYDVYMKTLIIKLKYKAYSTGFGASTMGHDQNLKLYGLVLCRGDVSASECKTCVSDATKEILNLCPYNKGAIIWYDYCMFKYLGTDFFGNIDTTNKFYLWNRNRKNDTAPFNLKTRELLSQLALTAYANPKLYAAGKLKLESSDTLYGLIQCTRDLSSTDCKKCLDDSINELPRCCDGQIGGRVVGGSCNFRYETYPFVKE